MEKWFKNNMVLKLMALAVSVLLWAMVHMDSGAPTPPTTIIDTNVIEDVKIQTYGFDDSEYALTGINIDRVNLEVRGKRSDLTTIFSDEYKVKLDLSSVKKPGTHTLPLTYSLPAGVELVSMDPSMVTVTVEERISKPVTVSIGTKGEPAKDYRAGEPVTIEPGSVNVTLPESELATLAQVRGTVDLDGAKENIVEKKVKLAAYNKEGKVMEDAIIEPSSVAVEIPVEASFVTVPLEMEYTGRLPEDLVLSKVNPKVKEVKLFGSKEALAGAKSYTGVTVNLGNVRHSGTTVLTADLTPPEGFEKIEPSSVQVEITAVSHGERVMDGIPVSLKGVPSGMEATITEPKSQSMSMTLTGAPDLLNSLQPTDIGLVANVAGLNAGVHDIPLQVTLPNLINRVDQKRLVVKVELKETDKPVTTEPIPKPDEGKDKEKPDEPQDKPGSGTDNGSGDGQTGGGEGGDHSGTEPPTGEGSEEETPTRNSTDIPNE
ncbi:CdaR family protein [Paenibacillus sp. N3/727]|uniref:CdaR family protein n=1 Tax=Paenibacillus sp. N3/727 TaxID=2925845 RepID=UPI001F534B5B|nr:CdaR family protein [Paenibacillus sp. N3/727]UNK17917.1 CdaR family protein [Paenibacillus sp. N3/727]